MSPIRPSSALIHVMVYISTVPYTVTLCSSERSSQPLRHFRKTSESKTQGGKPEVMELRVVACYWEWILEGILNILRKLFSPGHMFKLLMELFKHSKARHYSHQSWFQFWEAVGGVWTPTISYTAPGDSSVWPTLRTIVLDVEVLKP